MKIFKTALVLTLIGVACGILIGFSHQITDPIIQENLRKQELKAFSSLYPNLDEAKKVENVSRGTIIEVSEIYKDGSLVGYVYKGFHNNDYSSSVEALVGINVDGVIAGVELLAMVQTTAAHTNTVIENAKVYKGMNVSEIDLVALLVLQNADNIYDTTAGASFGSQSMRTIVKDAISIFNESIPPVVSTPYNEIFGPDVTNTVDTTFDATDKVIKKEIIKNASDEVLGYAYTLSSIKNTGTGSNLTEYIQDQDWNLTLLVGVDVTGKFLGIYMVEYDHTKNYIEKHLPYFESLIGVSVASFGDVDTISGATASLAHINELLTALQGVIN